MPIVHSGRPVSCSLSSFHLLLWWCASKCGFGCFWYFFFSTPASSFLLWHFCFFYSFLWLCSIGLHLNVQHFFYLFTLNLILLLLFTQSFFHNVIHSSLSSAFHHLSPLVAFIINNIILANISSFPRRLIHRLTFLHCSDWWRSLVGVCNVLVCCATLITAYCGFGAFGGTLRWLVHCIISASSASRFGFRELPALSFNLIFDFVLISSAYPFHGKLLPVLPLLFFPRLTLQRKTITRLTPSLVLPWFLCFCFILPPFSLLSTVTTSPHTQ